jgi:membrane fusion protein (multidrug efflux system)
MKKIILKSVSLLLLAGIIISCGTIDEKETIKQQIKEHKDQVSQLNIKIKELEQQLDGLGDKEDQFITPVKASEIQYRPFNHYFQVSGTVDATNKAYISPEINGQVKKIYVNEGDWVNEGQMLAVLNTSITENTIQEVKTQLSLAKTLYEKQKQLWEKNIGSEVQFLQAKNNMESLENKLKTMQAQLDMAYIKSPINGIVDAIFIEVGEMAMPGFQIMQVINLKKLDIYADVSEKYLPVIKKGDVVSLSFPTFPGIEKEVKVHRIGNVVKLGNRTFPVELKIDNIDDVLKPNVLALITFLDFSEENALVVPSIIIKKDINGEYIYIARNNSSTHIAKKVYVTTGMSYNDETMITSGLDPGVRVITEGYSLVTDGTEVKII